MPRIPQVGLGALPNQGRAHKHTAGDGANSDFLDGGTQWEVGVALCGRLVEGSGSHEHRISINQRIFHARETPIGFGEGRTRC